MHRTLILLLILFSTALSAKAETRYVTDQLLVSVRPIQDETSVPLERLISGTPVEVIADLGDFLKIKTPSGNIGYTLSRYYVPVAPGGGHLDSLTSAKELLAAQRQIQELTDELQRIKSLPANTTDLSVQLEKSQNDLAALNKRYQSLEEAQKGGSELLKERDQLRSEVNRLKGSKNGQNMQISGASPLQWFLTGAGILILGWLAGRASTPKRRY